MSKSPAAAVARNEAMKRLIDNHREEFDAMYREEADKRGVKPRPSRAEMRANKIQRLEAQLQELKGK